MNKMASTYFLLLATITATPSIFAAAASDESIVLGKKRRAEDIEKSGICPTAKRDILTATLKITQEDITALRSPDKETNDFSLKVKALDLVEKLVIDGADITDADLAAVLELQDAHGQKLKDSIKQISVGFCNQLTTPEFSECINLQSLSIKESPTLQKLIISKKTNIESMSLSHCPALTKIAAPNATKLKTITLANCRNITDKGIGHLCPGMTLILSLCKKINKKNLSTEHPFVTIKYEYSSF